MAEKSLEEVLGEFNSDDYTVKLVSAIYSIIPGSPEFVFYNNLEGAVNRIAPGNPDVLAKAQALAKSEEMKKALWVTDAIDMADSALGLYSGIKNVFSLFGKKEEKKRTFESDPQQATDAALKAVGLSYMIYKMYPGGVTEKIGAFKNTPAGKELAIYYGVAEVALPFTDNLAEGGSNLISKLMSNKEGDMTSKFTSFAGADALGQAKGVMEQFTGPLGEYVDAAKGHTGPIMEKVKGFMPSAATALNVGDSVTGAVATGVDMMPVWRFLGGRVVAEACAYRAANGL